MKKDLLDVRKRYIAYKLVAEALKDGTLIPEPCEHPGCNVAIAQAHHDDYDKPLDVRWLCRAHHVKIPKEKRTRTPRPTPIPIGIQPARLKKFYSHFETNCECRDCRPDLHKRKL